MNSTKITKKCSDCHETKPADIKHFFPFDSEGKYLMKRCQVCEVKRRVTKGKEYYEKAKLRAKEKQANKDPSVKDVRQPIKLKPQSELDRLFSLIIRTAHPKFCHSCGKRHEVSEAQTGHIINRTKFAVRYDLRNALPVCCACNYFVEKHTEPLIKRVIELYGENVYDEVNIKRYDEFKATTEQRNWLEAMFKTLLKSLTEDTERNVQKLIETQKMIDNLFEKII
jgi:hypothetical protein